MISFNGKLYLGAGNSSNGGPAPNAGPVPVISYDPATNLFSSVFVVDEDQIDVFYEFEGKLYIPGHDPKEDWSLGNFYTLSPGGWKKHRTIPGAIHTYVMTMHKGLLFAGLGTKNKKSIAVSSDYGQSWNRHQTGSSRIYDFMIVDDQLFALGPLYAKTFADQLKGITAFTNTPVMHFKESYNFEVRKDLIIPERIFPDTEIDPTSISKAFQNTQYEGKSIYIGAKIHNDHHALPFGAYVASSLAEDKIVIEKVPLPAGSIPWDILVKGETVYILAERKGEKITEVSVWQSNNAKNWHELFYFEHSTFARSFEKIEGDFYFSSGSEVYDKTNLKSEILSRDTGKIFRLKNPEKQ